MSVFIFTEGMHGPSNTDPLQVFIYIQPKKAEEFNPNQNQKSYALNLWQILFNLLHLFDFLWMQIYLGHGFSVASIIAASCLVKVVLVNLEEHEFYKWQKISF